MAASKAAATKVKMESTASAAKKNISVSKKGASATSLGLGKKPKKGKKRRESYMSHISRLLKQIHLGIGISYKAKSIMNSFANNSFERVAREASRLTHYNKKTTLSSREIQTVIFTRPIGKPERMRSMSVSQWICPTLALLVVALFANSEACNINIHAFECYTCDMVNEPTCIPEKCSHKFREARNYPGMGSEFTCTGFYKYGKMIWKGCNVKKLDEEVLEGSNKCVVFPMDQYLSKYGKALYKYYKARIVEGGSGPIESETEFVEDLIKSRHELHEGTDYDPNIEFTVCSCSTDRCNDDEFDKKVVTEEDHVSMFKSWKNYFLK